MRDFDVLIIGAGQAGIPLAREVAKSGRRVAVAERKFLGGSCVNFGCTPTKAVLASARVAHTVRRAAEFGINVSTSNIDFARVLDRARKMVQASRGSLAKGLDECGATVLFGQARFIGQDAGHFKLAVGAEMVHARQVVINTGTRTLLPAIAGLGRVDYLHAGNWLDQQAIPSHVIFAGAGAIALEMAQFYRRLGAAVTVIGPESQIAAHEDLDVATALQKMLEAEGIRFVLESRLTAVEPIGTQVRMTVESGGASQMIDGSHLFIAAGRCPNTDDLGLETVGVKLNDHGFITIDERLATSVPGIWAAGDVRGGPMFTHTSWDDHRILESQLLGDGRRTLAGQTGAGRIVPYAIFTDPELGRVGMTEREATAQIGQSAKAVTFEMKHNGRAVEDGEATGFIKLIVDHRNDKLLGAAVLAAEGAELVGSLITLMNADAGLEAIRNGIYIHPTLSEAVQSAALALKPAL